MFIEGNVDGAIALTPDFRDVGQTAGKQHVPTVFKGELNIIEGDRHAIVPVEILGNGDADGAVIVADGKALNGAGLNIPVLVPLPEQAGTEGVVVHQAEGTALGGHVEGVVGPGQAHPEQLHMVISFRFRLLGLDGCRGSGRGRGFLAGLAGAASQTAQRHHQRQKQCENRFQVFHGF